MSKRILIVGSFRFIGSSQEPVRSGASDDRLAMKSKTVTSVDVVSLSDICIRNLGGRHLWISWSRQTTKLFNFARSTRCLDLMPVTSIRCSIRLSILIDVASVLGVECDSKVA